MASNFSSSSLNANFRKYGGINNTLRQKLSKTYSSTSQLNHTTDFLGEPATKLDVNSHFDMKGHAILNISEIKFSNNTVQTTAYEGTSVVAAPAPSSTPASSLTIQGNLVVDGTSYLNGQVTCGTGLAVGAGVTVGAGLQVTQFEEDE